VPKALVTLPQLVKGYAKEVMRLRELRVDCEDATADLRCLL
jgi:hypothetical protein